HGGPEINHWAKRSFNLEAARRADARLARNFSTYDAIRTGCWPVDLFASRLHKSVGPFALSAGPPVGVFAQSTGPTKPLFASPRGTVRKPLQIPLWSHTGGVATSLLPRSSGCDAQTAVLFSPPRDGFSILDDRCKLLI